MKKLFIFLILFGLAAAFGVRTLSAPEPSRLAEPIFQITQAPPTLPPNAFCICVSYTPTPSPTPSATPSPTVRPTSTTVPFIPSATLTRLPSSVPPIIAFTPTPEDFAQVTPGATPFDRGGQLFQVIANAGVVTHVLRGGRFVRNTRVYAVRETFIVDLSHPDWCLIDTVIDTNGQGKEIFRVRHQSGDYYIPWKPRAAGTTIQGVSEFTRPDDFRVRDYEIITPMCHRPGN